MNVVLILMCVTCIASAIAASTQLYMIYQYHCAVKSLEENSVDDGNYPAKGSDDGSDTGNDRKST